MWHRCKKGHLYTCGTGAKKAVYTPVHRCKKGRLYTCGRCKKCRFYHCEVVCLAFFSLGYRCKNKIFGPVTGVKWIVLRMGGGGGGVCTYAELKLPAACVHMQK